MLTDPETIPWEPYIRLLSRKRLVLNLPHFMFLRQLLSLLIAFEG